MPGENPYAPPQADELESHTVFSHNHWKIYSNTLIVRNGATLPKVDLETGDRETARHPIRLSPDSSLFGFLRSSDPDTIHAFVTTRTRFARIRRTIREASFNVSIFAIVFTGYYPYSGVVLIAMFAALAIWGILDKTKLKVEISAKPGWLRITEIHPVALAYLRSIAKPTSTS
jgi:hypothetical protein